MKRLRLFFLLFAFANILASIAVLHYSNASSVAEILRPLLADTHRTESSFRYPGSSVIVIGIDTLRPDHTTMFGYARDTTPNLNRFARESFLFTHAYDAAPWTLPSFMSLFTALYPSIHGVTNKWTVVSKNQMVETRLSPTVTTLPQLLKRQGYLLGGFTGDAGVGGKYGFANGFDVYSDDLHFGGIDHSAPKALEWLAQAHGKPFFLFLHGYDCHGQYTPPGGYTRRFVKDYHGPLTGSAEEDARLREEGLRNALKPDSLGDARLYDMTPADAQFYRDLYDERIYDADDRVGQFLAQIKATGLFDRSIVVVVSDHGDEFMDHGSIDHGQSLYDELTNVLLMIHFPHQSGGRVVDDYVSLLDVLPTVLDSLQVPIPFHVNGISLLPTLRGTHRQRDLYCETDYRLFVHKRSIRSGRWVYIYSLQTGGQELYDTRADPGEHNNLASSRTRLAYEMEQKLMAWLHGMNTDVESFRHRQEDYIKEF